LFHYLNFDTNLSYHFAYPFFKIIQNMALPRIKVAKEQAELVQKLLDTKGTTGAFQTYADIIAFAASLGAKHQKRVKLTEVSQNEPAPISLEVFISRGYEPLIKLIAVSETQDIKILATDTTAEAQRNLIFEEYANGGLVKLKNELRGAVDFTERLLLILNAERFAPEVDEQEFDLSRFL
jgi:dnd system-associated protein 4